MKKEILTKKNNKILTTVITVAFIIIAIAIVCGITIGKGGFSDNYHKKLDKAQEYLNKMDYEMAKALFEEAIEINPKLVDAYIGLEEVYLSIAVNDAEKHNLADAQQAFIDAKAILDSIPEPDDNSSDDDRLLYEKAYDKYCRSVSLYLDRQVEIFVTEIFASEIYGQDWKEYTVNSFNQMILNIADHIYYTDANEDYIFWPGGPYDKLTVDELQHNYNINPEFYWHAEYTKDDIYHYIEVSKNMCRFDDAINVYFGDDGLLSGLYYYNLADKDASAHGYESTNLSNVLFEKSLGNILADYGLNRFDEMFFMDDSYSEGEHYYFEIRYAGEMYNYIYMTRVNNNLSVRVTNDKYEYYIVAQQIPDGSSQNMDDMLPDRMSYSVK